MGRHTGSTSHHVDNIAMGTHAYQKDVQDHAWTTSTGKNLN